MFTILKTRRLKIFFKLFTLFIPWSMKKSIRWNKTRNLEFVMWYELPIKSWRIKNNHVSWLTWVSDTKIPLYGTKTTISLNISITTKTEESSHNLTYFRNLELLIAWVSPFFVKHNCLKLKLIDFNYVQRLFTKLKGTYL